jgi:hypothetical protein
MKKLLFVVGALVLSGCTVVLSAAGKNVQLMKDDPPRGCKEVGSVKGVGINGALDEAKIDVRNNAAGMGANYVRWETLDQRGAAPVLTGTAYSCPSESAHP